MALSCAAFWERVRSTEYFQSSGRGTCAAGPQVTPYLCWVHDPFLAHPRQRPCPALLLPPPPPSHSPFSLLLTPPSPPPTRLVPHRRHRPPRSPPRPAIPRDAVPAVASHPPYGFCPPVLGCPLRPRPLIEGRRLHAFLARPVARLCDPPAHLRATVTRLTQNINRHPTKEGDSPLLLRSSGCNQRHPRHFLSPARSPRCPCANSGILFDRSGFLSAFPRRGLIPRPLVSSGLSRFRRLSDPLSDTRHRGNEEVSSPGLSTQR